MKRKEYDHSKLEGIDLSIEVSLKEYGFAWIETDTEYLFYCGIHQTEIDGNIDYDRFDFFTVDKNTDIKKEYDWVDWDDIFSFSDIQDWEDWMDLPLPQQLFTLSQYYGVFTVFGEPYWEGLLYTDIVKE